MSRTVTISHQKWDNYPLEVIKIKEDGSWGEWEVLREHPIAKLFSYTDSHTWEDALAGHSMPLIKGLGLPPSGSLIKTEKDILLCFHKDTCAAHDKQRCLGHKNPPACYSANAGSDDLEDMLRIQMTKVLQLWRDGIYILVVDTKAPQ